MRHWIIWVLWMAMWLMVSGVAIADPLQDQCAQQIRSVLLERLPNARPDDCQISFVRPEQWTQLRALLAQPGYSGKCEFGAHASLLGSISVPFGIYAQGTLVRRVMLAVKTQVQVPVVELIKDVSRGTMITASDIKVTRQLISRVPHEALRGAETVVGMQARMPLAKGSVLLPWMIGSKPLVYTNDTVQILCKGPSFILKVLGTAMQDGALHDRIRVKNVDSQKILLAEVLDDKKVLVTSGSD